MDWGRGNSETPILGEGFLVGVHVVLDCHRRPVPDDLDEVGGSAEDPVLVVDGIIAEALDEVRGESLCFQPFHERGDRWSMLGSGGVEFIQIRERMILRSA